MLSLWCSEANAPVSFNILTLVFIFSITSCYRKASGAIAISSTFHFAERKEAKQGGQKECIFQLNQQTPRKFHTTLKYIIRLNIITWPYLAEREVGKITNFNCVHCLFIKWRKKENGFYVQLVITVIVYICDWLLLWFSVSIKWTKEYLTHGVCMKVKGDTKWYFTLEYNKCYCGCFF